MDYVYPAIFHENGNGSITVTFPDLPGCTTEGKSMANAVSMAQKTLTQWLDCLSGKKERLPKASDEKLIALSAGERVNLICVEAQKEFAVRRAVSLPKWLDDLASEANLSLSRVLQEALKKELLSPKEEVKQ